MGAHNKPDSLRGVRAVIFDFDGTLAVLNIDFSFMREKVFDLMRHYGVEGNMIEERYVLEIIDEVTQQLGKKDASKAETFYQEAHRILHGIEMEAAGKGKLLPGVEGALTFLRRKGVSVGIVTRNCEEAVRKVFPGIDHYCDVFIARNSIKKVKPHPEHLTTTLNRLKVRGEESLMVGDHPIDIHAGKRVGMKTVGVLTGRMKREDFEKAGADYILKDAPEVCGLLEK
jgi:phosphoglycolate phosphatase